MPESKAARQRRTPKPSEPRRRVVAELVQELKPFGEIAILTRIRREATAMRITSLASKPGQVWILKTCVFCSVAVLLVLPDWGCGDRHGNGGSQPPPEVTFKAQEMADALHAVIAADRDVYSRLVLQRLGADEKMVKVSPHWQEDKSLPLPAQVLRLGSEVVQREGAEFHYILRSLWPINPRNGPETPTEKKGLQSVLEHPETNYYSEESLGGRRYFTAVYPDRASVSSCIECHNAHPTATKKDFKVGDVMGGIIVRVPLEF